MSLRYDTVSFLSDYGRADEFVGIVHSVLRVHAPDVRVIDITHDIRPYDVRAGGLALVRAAAHLAPGVVIAVVDPTVGTSRRAIAAEVGGGTSVLVGPDNGLLAPVVSACGGPDRVVEITNTDVIAEGRSGTFDGRDVFAPAAAFLCNGGDLAELGPAIDPYSLMPAMLPLPREEEGRLHAEVLWIDRYGNIQLNVEEDVLAATVAGRGEQVRLVFEGGSRIVRVVGTFAELAKDEVGLLVDAYGLYAIVLDRASAAEALGVVHAGTVTIERLDQTAPPSIVTPVDLGARRT